MLKQWTAKTVRATVCMSRTPQNTYLFENWGHFPTSMTLQDVMTMMGQFRTTFEKDSHSTIWEVVFTSANRILVRLLLISWVWERNAGMRRRNKTSVLLSAIFWRKCARNNDYFYLSTNLAIQSFLVCVIFVIIFWKFKNLSKNLRILSDIREWEFIFSKNINAFQTIKAAGWCLVVYKYCSLTIFGLWCQKHCNLICCLWTDNCFYLLSSTIFAVNCKQEELCWRRCEIFGCFYIAMAANWKLGWLFQELINVYCKQGCLMDPHKRLKIYQ